MDSHENHDKTIEEGVQAPKLESSCPNSNISQPPLDLNKIVMDIYPTFWPVGSPRFLRIPRACVLMTTWCIWFWIPTPRELVFLEPYLLWMYYSLCLGSALCGPQHLFIDLPSSLSPKEDLYPNTIKYLKHHKIPQQSPKWKFPIGLTFPPWAPVSKVFVSSFPSRLPSHLIISLFWGISST